MKKIFSLENYIYLVIIFLPSYLVRFRLLNIPTNVLEVLIIIAFAWWLIGENSKHIFIKGIDKRILLSFGIILFGLITSVIVNKNYAVGFGIIKGWLIFPLILTAMIYDYFSKEKMINIFKALYASSFLVSLASLVYLFFGRVTYDLRLQAFFNSPNYLAMYLAPGVLIGIFLNKKILYMPNAVILIALYFTYSYAAWVSVATALILIFIYSHKFSKKYLIIFCLIILTLIFALKDTEKFKDLAGFSDRSSLESRMMIWESSARILKDNWIFGIGPGGFQEKYLEYQKYFPPYLEWAIPHPHNIYLAFWLYGGVAGLLGFIVLVYCWFKNAVEVDNNPVKFIALAIMSYVLIHGLIDTTIFKNDLAIIFWLNFLVLKR